MLLSDIDFSPETINFVGFGDKTGTSKKEVMGKKLWDLVFQRDNNFGGFLVGLFGLMGSGKTSLMHQMAKRTVKENPDEIIFWREPINNPLQANNFDGEYQILCERRYPVKVWKIASNSLQPTNNIKIHKFTGYRELLKMANPGMLNVIYFHKPYQWLMLIDKFKDRGTWQSFYFDEFEDIAPLHAKGKQWHMNQTFTGSLKEIRKARINICYNTQNSMEIWFGITAKTMIHFYLYGAREDRLSPIFKQALQNLDLGQGWIDWGHSKFGLINFKPVHPKNETYIIKPIGKPWGGI